jgi:hypothetical protein
MNRQVPRILNGEQDFAEAAEDMGIPRVDFGAMTDDEVSAIARVQRAADHPEYGRMLAARLEIVRRLCSAPRMPEGTGAAVKASR